MWPNTGSDQNSINSAWEATDAEAIYGVEKYLKSRRVAKEAEEKALLAEIKKCEDLLEILKKRFSDTLPEQLSRYNEFCKEELTLDIPPSVSTGINHHLGQVLRGDPTLILILAKQAEKGKINDRT